MRRVAAPACRTTRAKPAFFITTGAVELYYRSFADLSRTIVENAARLPDDIDLVVGVPRSGLLAANMLALHLNVRLADFDGFLADRAFATGRRPVAGAGNEVRHALVLDDSVSTGSQMTEIVSRLAGRGPGCRVTTAAVYVAPEKADLVDFRFETLGNPRVFEWNLMNNYMMANSCMDIDGVLCLDPTDAENDDGRVYERFLAEVRPLHRPKVKVGWLVTSRLERYRAATEAWLAKHGVEYGELLMLDLPSKEARQRERAHGRFKAWVYSRTLAGLFVESDPAQAREIAALSGKPVLCVETHRMYYPSTEEMVHAKVARAPWTLTKKVRRLGGETARRLLKLPRYPSQAP